MKKLITLSFILAFVFFVSCEDNGSDPETIDAPGLFAPDNNADQVQLDIILDWNDVGVADEYHLQVATDIEFTGTIVDEGLEESEFSLDGYLNYMTTYYWRVRTTTVDDQSEWSEVRSFTTMEQPQPALELIEADEKVSGFSSDSELVSYAKIKNNSSDTVSVEVKLIIINLYKTHATTLCTGDLCYPQKTDDFTAPLFVKIAPGDTAYKKEFSAHHYPYRGAPGEFNEPGTSRIKYLFTNTANPADTVSYTCEYKFM